MISRGSVSITAYLGEHVWPPCEFIECPGEHGSAGLMASQQEGLHFIAELRLQYSTPCLSLSLHADSCPSYDAGLTQLYHCA